MSGAEGFCDYERMMLKKIKRKSFMMSMGKALAWAGYTKNVVLSGRALRWNLPEVGDGAAVVLV